MDNGIRGRFEPVFDTGKAAPEGSGYPYHIKDVVFVPDPNGSVVTMAPKGDLYPESLSKRLECDLRYVNGVLAQFQTKYRQDKFKQSISIATSNDESGNILLLVAADMDILGDKDERFITEK